jgi:hypothetical protein
LFAVQATRAAAGGTDGAPQPAKQRRLKQTVDVHDLTLLGMSQHCCCTAPVLNTAAKQQLIDNEAQLTAGLGVTNSYKPPHGLGAVCDI